MAVDRAPESPSGNSAVAASSAGAETPSLIEMLVFVAELLLLAAFALAGARAAGPTGLRIALAILAPLVVATVWGRWLAPRASRRLGPPSGPTLKIALFTVAAVLVGLTGLIWISAAFWLVTAPLIVVVERSRGRH